MKFSMKGAAREVGISPTTMHRRIKSGRISATRLDDGSYEIDASELARAFPDGWPRKGAPVPGTGFGDAAEPGGTSPGTIAETAALRAEVKMLREMLERADLSLDQQRRAAANTIDDLRARLDREGEERRALNARLLTYQAPPPVAADPAGVAVTPSPPPDGPPPSPPPKKGFFGR